MKKLLSLFISVLLAATAMAGETKTFYDNLHWEGDVSLNQNGKHDLLANVEITDNEDGTYDITLKDVFIYRSIGDVLFYNVPGETKGLSVVLSSKGEPVEGVVHSTGTDDKDRRWDGAKCSMTIEGMFRGDDAYLYISGNFAGWSDNPFIFVFGVQMDAVSAIYKEPCKVTYAGEPTNHANDEIDLVDNGDNTYKLIYKDFKFSANDIELSDYVIDKLEVTESEGRRHFSYNGLCKLKNLAEFATQVGFREGQEIAISLSGVFDDTHMYVTGTVPVAATATADIVYGTDPSTWVTGISDINATNNADTQIFTVSGMKANRLQKGLNIVKTGGKTKKILVK